MKRFVSPMAHGAVAGVIGASCMTLLRMLLHRAGVLEQMVPQAVERWARGRTPSRSDRDVAEQHVADQLIHLAYGMAWGAMYGALVHGTRAGRGAPQAAAFGLVQWAFGSMVLFPVLQIGRPAWRSAPLQNAINVSAHLVYGGVTAFLTEEFERQRRDQPRSYAESRRAQVG